LKRFLHILIRFIISASLIIFVFSKSDLKNVLNCLREANIPLLIFSLSLHFVGVLLGSSRWRVLLESYGINVPHKDLYRLYMIGSFFNTFLPTSVGGDAIRMYKVSALTDKRAQAVTSVLIERFIGMLILYIISFFSFIFYFGFKREKELFLAIVILLFASIGFIIFLFSILSEKIIKIVPSSLLKEKLDKIHYSLKYPVKDPKNLFKVFTYTTLLQINVVIYFFIISIAIKMKLSIIYFFILIPIILTVTMLPITIGGIGLREGGFVFLFSRFGVLPEEALTLSILGYFISLVFAGFGGLVYIFEGKK